MSTPSSAPERKETPTLRLRRLAPLVVLGLGLALAACGGEPITSPSGTPSATPTPSRSTTASASPSPTPAVPSPTAGPASAPADDGADRQGVESAVSRYYATYNRISQDPEVDALTIYDVAIDPANDKAYAQLLAIREAGQRQTGDIVATVETYIAGEGGEIFYADVCVDMTAVDILDAEGQSVWTTGDARRTYATIHVVRTGSTYIVGQVTPSVTDPC